MTTPRPAPQRLTPTAPHERRLDRRYQLRAQGLVADAENCFDCVVADISVGGAMLEGDLPFSAGQEVALGFDSLMGMICEVVYRGTGFVGVRFKDDGDSRKKVAVWIAARARDARRHGERT